MDYYVYSARAQGWYTEQGTYSSDPKVAAKFSREAALAITKRAYNKAMGELVAIPVLAADMDEVLE